MNQKTRDKIAWGLAIVLAPILIYLVATSMKGARRAGTNSASSGEATEPSGPIVPLPLATRHTSLVPPSISPEMRSKQAKLADALPTCNPFSVAQRAASDAGLHNATAALHGIKVTGIVTQRGSTQRLVIINGKVLEQGELIDGWAVVRINRDDVVLDSGTKRMTVIAK